MKKKKPERKKSLFREYFELIAETAVFVFFVMTFVVQAFQIPTGSMEPTLLVGDFLLVNKFAYAPTVFPFEDIILPRKKFSREDIVVFKYPREMSKDFVKRVIGLPGEEISIKGKQVYINGRPIPENYKVHIDDRVYPESDSYNAGDSSRDNFNSMVVPSGQLFVMGDNRDNSQDSRVWGLLPIRNIKGKPWMIYFSYEAESDAYLKTSFREKVAKLLRFIPAARWKRLFKIIN